MNFDRELLELECRVRFVELAASQEPDDTPLDLFADGFWECARALSKPRSFETLTGIIEMHRARAAGLIKENVCAQPIPLSPSDSSPSAAPSKRPRRVSRF